ncbi:hypothetical protein HD554DRAFT_1553177 [Boletus coccyginus]|nr:hypothetical protein HD554DRAFT_1553177 [Boletus coccyginus]
MLHLPLPIEDAKLEETITTMRTPSLDLDTALRLYHRLNELPAPWFAASRMKLPCIAFKLPPLSPSRATSGRIYRVETPFFGTVEIKTRQDMSRLNSLYLVHPWLDNLLDHDDMQTGLEFMEDDIAEPLSPDTEDEDIFDEEIDEEIEEESLPPPEPRIPSTPAIGNTEPMDKETRALRLIARLRQPFGGLLLTLTLTRRRSVVYRRVAADSTIVVQIRENVPLADILGNVRILDVL